MPDDAWDAIVIYYVYLCMVVVRCGLRLAAFAAAALPTGVRLKIRESLWLVDLVVMVIGYHAFDCHAVALPSGL